MCEEKKSTPVPFAGAFAEMPLGNTANSTSAIAVNDSEYKTPHTRSAA